MGLVTLSEKVHATLSPGSLFTQVPFFICRLRIPLTCCRGNPRALFPNGPGVPKVCCILYHFWGIFYRCINTFYVFVLSCFSHVQVFVTPWTVTHQAPLCMGFSSQEYWSGLPFSPLGDLPDPGVELASLMSPAPAGMFFTTSVTWEALTSCVNTGRSLRLLMSHFLICKMGTIIVF